MKLPDFTEFEPFNGLREKMNATELGFFELFNPQFHLTGFERSELETKGLFIPRSTLSQLIDFTICFKNSRVVVVDEQRFHLCRCENFPKDEELFIATSSRIKGLGAVCNDCLQQLHFDGYDNSKARRESYSRQVAEQFTLERFWQQFKLYPVSEKKEIRKRLDEE